MILFSSLQEPFCSLLIIQLHTIGFTIAYPQLILSLGIASIGFLFQSCNILRLPTGFENGKQSKNQ